MFTFFALENSRKKKKEMRWFLFRQDKIKLLVPLPLEKAKMAGALELTQSDAADLRLHSTSKFSLLSRF